MLRHADSDLLAVINSSVPPCDINKVSIFADYMAKYGKEVEQTRCLGSFWVGCKLTGFKIALLF